MSVEAKNLMIGNFVKVPECMNSIGRIIEIDEDECYLDLYSFGENNYSYDGIEPILLTEEIMLKCGFEKIPNSQFVRYWRKDFIEIHELYYLDKPEFTLVPFLTSQNNFCYLHQLQNLYFAITAEKLEVNF